MAFDQDRSVWSLAGSQWLPISTSTGAPEFHNRSDTALFDDPNRAQVVFAHSTGASALRGGTWVDVPAMRLPSVPLVGPRGVSVHTDPGQQRLLTWPGLAEFRDGAWSVPPQEEGPSPSPARGRSAFDPVHGRLWVVDSHAGSESIFGGVWSRTDRWQQPLAHYRRPRRCTSISGGAVGGSFWCIEPGRTWYWTGSRWTRTATASSPNAAGTLVYDAGRNALHLHNAQRSYTLEGGEWVPGEATPESFGAAEADLRAVHDPATDTTVAVTQTETWYHDGAIWRQATMPSRLVSSDLFFDSGAQRTRVLFWSRFWSPSWPVTGFAWTGSGWSATSAPRAPPRGGYYDPWRAGGRSIRGPLKSWAKMERIGVSKDLCRTGRSHQDAWWSVDEARNAVVVMTRDRPDRLWVAPRRTRTRPGVHLSYDIRPRAELAPRAIHLELVGGGLGYSPTDGTPIEGFEVWFWRWDRHAYQQVAEVDHALGVTTVARITVDADARAFLEPDRRLHMFIRTRGPLGRGPALPTLELDLLHVLVDFMPGL